MAAYISFQPSDFFSSTLYTGNGVAYGSGGNAITGVGFQPALTWIKCRTVGEEPVITDAVRGVTKILRPNDTYAESTAAEGLNVFGSDGFTLGLSSQFNEDTEDYVSWNWKMGTTSGLTGGTITPSSYSLNTTARQSIIAYTGTGSAATIPHGLGVVPNMIIVKALNAATDWAMYHTSNTSPPEDYIQVLNTYAVAADNNLAWNDTAPTSTLFSVNAGDTNATSKTHIAYCFADVKGYSKFGGYTGNGNIDGTFVYTGFRPAYLLFKRVSGATANWYCYDCKRLGYNEENASFQSNTAAVEALNIEMYILSNGFKWRDTDTDLNASGAPYLYAAFAEFPFVSSNSIPGMAR